MRIVFLCAARAEVVGVMQSNITNSDDLNYP